MIFRTFVLVGAQIICRHFLIQSFMKLNIIRIKILWPKNRLQTPIRVG
jgi:hypothetical protein